jgi:histidinol-phosphate/aromatic aminotransferase/cobyric acid decarboxylase-like protein
MFNVISTVTPVIPSAGYFTAVVCGNSSSQGRFQLFDELLEKGVGRFKFDNRIQNFENCLRILAKIFCSKILLTIISYINS